MPRAGAAGRPGLAGNSATDPVARLSDAVFHHAFPRLASAVAAAAPVATLVEARDAALAVLYRLLFVRYAEAHGLLQAGGQGDAACSRFAARCAPLLATISLDKDVMAEVVDVLSFEHAAEGCRPIDYRALRVRHLGSIYERLLALELVRDGADVVVRPDISARRTLGSYYTPDDLVALIIRETVGPLAAARMAAFQAEIGGHGVRGSSQPGTAFAGLDPASRLLELKICDPAMGAGHFLVSLVDDLADRIIAAMAEAEEAARTVAITEGVRHVSPLRARVAAVRSALVRQAAARGVTLDPARLDDRHIVRRMVAARCVYGVDKNPMAVELARTALQLHTLIPGAPPVFLDHHLRCGDSLFGLTFGKSVEKAAALGQLLPLQESAARAAGAAAAMQAIDELNDTGADAREITDAFAAVQEMTAPLDVQLSLLQAFDWLGEANEDEAGRLIAEERFLNWEAAFPDVWPGLVARAARESQFMHGAGAAFATAPGQPGDGFDAVIGNPPWERMKLQQVEWFAARRRDIAFAPRAADRARMIAALMRSGDPLAQDFARANARAERAARMARACGDYPLMSGGDINVYSLFVERAMALVKPRGLAGLLVPSGIACDKTAAPFFRSVAAGGRLRTLYDFENRRTRAGAEPFFPDVDGRFKFCVFVASPSPLDAPARCAFFLHDVAELADAEKCVPLTAGDFARVNPNTGTAPVFRTRRDADLTIAIYRRLPVLADRSAERSLPPPPFAGEREGSAPAAPHERDTAARGQRRAEARAWPVRYATMFHMTNDSHLFRTKAELIAKENAHSVGGNRWHSERGLWLPLYEGKMAQAFDHRAASVILNLRNRHRPAQPQPATLAQHRDPAWLPQPQYFVEASRCGWRPDETWVLGFKEITSPTNERTFVAALFPAVAFGNKLPLLRAAPGGRPAGNCCGTHLLCANLNSIVFDFVVRQKIHGQTLNRYIVEQLPVVPPERYGRRFGDRTAAEIVADAVLELTYTSHDMAPFAADMGFVDAAGAVRPPFAWDAARRIELRAKLDAVYFHLYGVTSRADVRYLYSTCPIVERVEIARYGRYLSRELCLTWMDALEAGRALVAM
jgi:hypothetical protein